MLRMTCVAAATHGNLSNRVSDGSMSAFFVIEYPKQNDDEVWELQGGI